MRHRLSLWCIVVTFATCTIFFCAGCASLSPGEIVQGEALTDATRRVEAIIDEQFVDALIPELKGVGVTFQKDVSVPIIGNDVVGYYNPLFDHITVEDNVAGRHCTVTHEFLHRVWFKNFWTWNRWSFWWDLDAVLADPNEKEFGDRVRERLKHRHWLNTLFAETTEIYSDIGEDILNGVPVPERLRRHYQGILRRADPEYASSHKDLEADSEPPENPPADPSPDSSQ